MADTEKDQVTTKLERLGVPLEVIEKIKTVLGAKEEADLLNLTESDLTATGVGMQALPARKLIKALTPVKTAMETASAALETASLINTVLPSVLSNESWLAALKAGGVLKVEQSTVEAAVRAALAHRVGLYEIPDILAVKMEAFADSNEEQIDPTFFEIRKQLTRRNYAEIFEAIKGFDGTYVTEARKKQLFQRIDSSLWPAIISFNNQLKDWYDAWVKTGMNPMMMMGAFLTARGGPGVVMPPAMMQPPDTGVLRDNADAVADAINKVFAGTGVQIAAALAYDANKIKETLTNPRLPAMIGAANRDQMLRQLGVALSPTYPRLETNMVQYVLSVIQAKDQPAGEQELKYFGALYMLGANITWDLLETDRPVGKRPSGIGGGRGSGRSEL